MRLSALLLLAFLGKCLCLCLNLYSHSCLFLGFVLGSETPTFSNQYVATGRILLPYAEIDEPFTAYYDAVANKSRIDYYGDLMQTVQRPDINQFYKLAWMEAANGNGPLRVCFSMGGTY